MFRKLFGDAIRSQRRCRHVKLALDSIESLETRLVLYAATGNAWPTSQIITISFQPDGTNLGGVNSDLFKEFNSNPNLAGRWQTEILRAAQTWSEVTNINFVLVTDNGTASGGGKYQQGDPGFGDIRIGGYDFNNSSLARAYLPPPANNFSIAGDIAFNTSIDYGIGTGYDLYSVALHEIGHALGLDHTSATSSSALWSSYNGIKTKLAADDIAGVRSIYSGNGPRSADDYDAKAANNTIGTAKDITSEIGKAAASAIVTDLDITTTSDVDFFKFTAPKWSPTSIVVSMQASGLSLLSPKLTVYAADQKTIIGTVTSSSISSGTVTVRLNGVDNGDVFYIKAEGNSSAGFAIGNYAITLDLGAKNTPIASSPKSTMANGKTPTSKGGIAEGAGEFDTMLAPTPVIQTIKNDSGDSTTDRTTNYPNIVLEGVAPLLSTVEIYQNGVSVGKFLNLLSAWSFSVPGTLADGDYTFVAKGGNVLGLLNGGESDAVTVTVDTTAPDAPTLDTIMGERAANGTLITQPTSLRGATAPSALITIYDNDEVFATTRADGYGLWSYRFDEGIADGAHRITITATDLAGNQSAPSASQSVNIDTGIATPVVTGITNDTGISDQDNITNARNLTVTGVAEAGSTVTVFRDGTAIGTTTASSAGTWTYDDTAVTLADGVYGFTARATDAVGHVSNLSDATLVTVDNELTTPTISYVTKTTSLFLLNTLTILGTAGTNASVGIYLNGSFLATTAADATGSWNYKYSPLLLGNGTYSLSAIVTDVAGNVARSNTFNLVLGSTAPTVSNLTLTGTGTTRTVSGTGTKGATISIFDGNQRLGTAVVASTGKWTFTTPSLAIGSRHTLVAVATDSSGTGLPSSALTFTV